MAKNTVWNAHTPYGLVLWYSLVGPELLAKENTVAETTELYHIHLSHCIRASGMSSSRRGERCYPEYCCAEHAE